MKWDRNKRMYHISIHALREEGDGTSAAATAGGQVFLSTPSARRATRRSSSAARYTTFLSTPSARRATNLTSQLFANIYIFLSTPSARRAT